jgi:hypothetical protein
MSSGSARKGRTASLNYLVGSGRRRGGPAPPTRIPINSKHPPSHQPPGPVDRDPGRAARWIRRRCSRCQRPAPGYDCLPERRWLFVRLRGIPTYFYYAPRRVECSEHGFVVEQIHWSDGKRPVTCTMMGFLARRAQGLSWRETARALQTSWEAVYRSVGWFVEWGRAHRQLSGVEAIGMDEIHWGRLKRADNFLRSPLPDRCTLPTFAVGWAAAFAGHAAAGTGGAGAGGRPRAAFCVQRHAKPYLLVIAAEARTGFAHSGPLPHNGPPESGGGRGAPCESTRLRAKSKSAAQRLKHMRGSRLRRGSRVRGRAR